MNTASGGVNQHGRGTVYHVTCRNLFVTRLEEIFFRYRRADGRNAAVDGENGTDRDVNIDVGRAIQWVHQHHVFCMFTAFKDENLIFFFRGNARNDIACFQCGFQFFISEQVEFLLNLALHVLSTAGTQDINQSCFVDIAMDNLGAQFYCRQQSSELTGSMRKLVLLFDNKFT